MNANMRLVVSAWLQNKGVPVEWKEAESWFAQQAAAYVSAFPVIYPTKGFTLESNKECQVLPRTCGAH